MRICQNPNCSNPFNAEGNLFCTSCGSNQFGVLLRNRYRVLSLIGEGGFSKTYAAEDVDKLNTPCVIKQFFPQVQETGARLKAAELFKEEAVHLYELGENHLQIPKLLAYFQQGLSLCLVQELIRGKTLLQELLTQSFNEADIIEMLMDLLSVLEFVHSRNVIHRDIKPDNIIRRQSDRKLVLIDFGGAKQVTQTSLARRATAIYTIGYAPSEQMAGFACQASDLYALGVTCIRMITQTLPEQDAHGQIHDRLYDAMNGRWAWREVLQEKGIHLSEGLGKILDKLLEYLPKERYQSATEALNDLRDLVFAQANLPTINSTSTVSASTVSASLPQPEPAAIAKGELEISKSTSTPSGLQIFEYEVATVDGNGNTNKSDRRSAKFFTEELGNGIILNMVLIPGGKFTMGSAVTEGDADERPQHSVSIETFFVSKFPVTQAQWRAVSALPPVKQTLHPNPSKFRGANRPVENVSWHEAREFCARVTQKTGRNYRLLSEAEWEYACRAGTTTPFHFGETITSQLVNCKTGDHKYRKETTTVGSFQVANGFGLYDMHGLVWEWCDDPWHKNYQGAPTDGTVWETGGDVHRRVLRGGSWNFTPDMCRSASRSWNESDGGLRISGFRLAMNFWDWIDFNK